MKESRINNIINSLQQKLDGYEFTVTSYHGGTGLMISHSGSNISPIFRIDVMDELSDQEIVMRIINLLNDPEHDACVAKFADKILNYSDDIFNYLHLRIYPKNAVGKFIPKDAATKDLFDFVECISIDFCETGDDTSMSIIVTNDLIEKWGTDDENLRWNAWLNTKRDVQTIEMGDILKSLVDNKDSEALNLEIPMMIIATNRTRTYGAIAMLNLAFLQDLSEKYDCEYFVIIPSSVHEVILLPSEESPSEYEIAMITGMIRQVNATEVIEKELLSDHPYLYNRTRNQVEPLYPSEEHIF